MIYFIQDAETRLVKIGFSNAPWQRFAKIQSDCPGELTMRALIDGGVAEEAALHVRFSAHRSRGEWFRAEASLGEFLALQALPVKPSGRNPFGPKAVADAIGISKSYASMILAGRQAPSLRVAAKIFDAFGERVGPLSNLTDEEAARVTGILDRMAA